MREAAKGVDSRVRNQFVCSLFPFTHGFVEGEGVKLFGEETKQ
jgi:hypothetical protein